MASAFAQGFQMGGSMYDSSERMKLAKEQQEWAREDALAKRAERQREDDIRTVGRETLGMEGQPLNSESGEMGLYTAERANQDYLKRLRGIDVNRAQQYEKGALELEGAQRTNRFGKNQELALGFNNQVIQDLTNANGDAAAVIEKTFLPLYNADKLPGFKDGGTAKLVPSAVGSDKSIVITYKDGKQEVLPADMKTLQQLTGYTQKEMMKSSSPENYWKAETHALDERKTAATESSAASTAKSVATQASELEQKIKSGLFGAEVALKNAQTKSALASANQANAHAGVYNNMVALAKENKEAGVAVKDALAKYEALSDAEKAGEKGQAILTAGALAAAKKTGDITGILNVLKKPDKSQAPEVSAEAYKNAYQDLREAGNDAEAIKAVKKKWPMVFGETKLDKAMGATADKPAETVVEGRPLYNKTNAELLRMTKRAIGTSTAEAREAQAELDARKGEPRMKAF